MCKESVEKACLLLLPCARIDLGAALEGNFKWCMIVSCFAGPWESVRALNVVYER